nr:ADP-ribosylation factor-like protein [Candidatus Sigynarchaeum springense]MDO8116323.1 ADP-ribosylation factor-like protein [Candidatus Sigynarchaeota archaeon]
MAAVADFSQKLKQSKKILFVGLDNSGKTSIILCLKGDFASLGLVNPTLLVERSTFQYLDYDLLQHDLGGQKQYIVNYFKEPGQYFDQADACIYVADVQDADRVNDALNYFKDVLAQFDALGIKPSIHVLLHKAERYIQDANPTDRETMEILQTRMSAAVGGRFPLAFAMTTITQPWTITSAFATIFNEILGRTEQYKKSIEDIAKATGATFAALFDKHGIPVVQNAKGKVQDDIVNLAAPYFFKIKEILGQIKSGTTDKIAIEWDNYEFLVLAIPEPIPLTLLVVGITGKIDKNAAPGIVRPIIKTMF